MLRVSSILPKNSQEEFEEGQFTLVYSVTRNIIKGKGAAAPSHPTALVRPTVSDPRMMQEIELNFLPCSMETAVTKQHHIFFSMIVPSCLAEAPSTLLLPLLYECFPFLPGPFLFPPPWDRIQLASCTHPES